MTADGRDREHLARSSSDQESLTFRPGVAGDDAAIVEIYTRQEADSVPLTIARYRAGQAEKVADSDGEPWVAVETGRVVGVGGLAPAWWTGQPGSYAVQVRIDQSHWRRGIGTRLYGLLRSRLIARDATRLVSWVRVDAANGRRFAARHGFRETGRVVEEYRLHVPEANTEAYDGLEEGLRRGGLRIASLAELGTDDEEFLRALQRLWAASRDEPPNPGRLRDSFPAWRREVLHAPGYSPETHWVALDGEHPVGTTFLKQLSEDAAENDYTGVASTHRGRGIAPALKLRAVAWARQHGVSWFYASSEIGNTRMIAINSRLGYEPGVQRLEVARDSP
jgi:RimJ/RimL family protein N-acetyltransferase